jgi:5-methylcytosine-specific restriction endonuclease McrA
VKIVTRAEAKAAGLKRYYTGKPCKRGHMTERLTSNLTCVECACEAGVAHQQKWYAANRTYAAKRNGSWNRKNLDRMRKANRKWRATHPEQAAVLATAHGARRRARKLAQTCVCCTPAQLREVYETARILGEHVDHIWPLAEGGKHCRHNLQVIPAEENLRKHAKLTGKDAMKYFYNLSI